MEDRAAERDDACRRLAALEEEKNSLQTALLKAKNQVRRCAILLLRVRALPGHPFSWCLTWPEQSAADATDHEKHLANLRDKHEDELSSFTKELEMARMQVLLGSLVSLRKIPIFPVFRR